MGCCCSSNNKVEEVNQDPITPKDQIRKKDLESESKKSKNRAQTEQPKKSIKPVKEKDQILSEKFKKEIKQEQKQQFSIEAKPVPKNKLNDENLELKEWKALIQNLENNTRLKNYALNKKRADFKSFADLIEYLKSFNAKSDTEMAYLAYVWITHNIDFDVLSYKNGNFSNNDPDNAFSSGKCVCYAPLYQEICKSLGLDCIKISGYSKGFDYKIGKIFLKTNHAWNAVKANATWRLVECTWGAGNLDNNYMFNKCFNPYYFFTPPHVFISDHYSESNQYLNKKMSLSDFERLPKLNLKYHLYGLKCLSYNTLVVSVPQNPLFFEFAAPKETLLSAFLYKQNGQDLIEDSTLTQRDAKTFKYGIIAFLPEKNENYILKIFAKSAFDAKEKLFSEVCVYKVVRTSEQNKFELPKYDIELDFGVKCLSHSSQLIYTNEREINLEFSVPDEVLILADVKVNGNKKVEGLVKMQKNPLYTEIKVSLPVNCSSCNLDMFTKRGVESYQFLSKYKIIYERKK